MGVGVPRWAWRYYLGCRPLVELGLCHGPPVLCDVLLLHEPGPRSARSHEELEGDQGIQERRLLAAKVSRREGREPAFAGLRCAVDQAYEGAGRLHWCEPGRPLQG